MKKIRMIFILLIVFIVATFAGVELLLNGDEILVSFEITELKNDYNNYSLTFNEVKAAEYYKVQIYNQNNIKIFDKDIKTNKLDFELDNLSYNQEYTLMVYAYDKLGESRPAEKFHTFKWTEPSFIKEDTILLNDQDYVINIDGELDKKEYKLKISYDDQVVEESIKENEYTLKKEMYEGMEKEVKVELLSGEKVIDSINLYNRLNPVGDINITSPQNEALVNYNDFTMTYEGGENALEYAIKVYKDGKKLIRSTTTKRKIVIFSKDLFEVGSFYRIDVIGKYGDYEKSASVSVAMSEQIQLNPVYISNNWKHVKKGTKIALYSNNDEETKIYYTLDGTNPESNGKPYVEPIEINEDVTLKTVSVKEGYKNSEVITYDINTTVKDKYIVYLSPSNQHGNIGVKSVGFTNEMDEMNDLSNYIEERLKEFDVKVYRNNPSGNINLWNRDSNYLGADLHLAIHSNASVNHDTYGVETWINTPTSPAYSLANQIQNGLINIYPYSDMEKANRGVKSANGALGEVNDLYVNNGILVEIAHHDYKMDAEWIMQNKKLIGYNIADSILRYYQIIE